MIPIHTVGIVVLKDDKVLLVKHGEKAGHITGVYGAPAGHIEANESAIHAAVRELKEETGLITDEKYLIELPIKYTAKIERKGGKVITYYHLGFACNKFWGNLRPTDETEPEWVELDKLNSLHLLPNITNMITQAKKYL